MHAVGAGSSFSWSDGAAWGGFVLSLLIAAIALLRTWRMRRTAEPVAWLERISDANYCVVTNCGSADAMNLTVAFSAQDGARVQLLGSEEWPTIDRLAAGDMLYLGYDHIPGRYPQVLVAELAWDDGRLRRQVRRRTTSVRPTGAGSSSRTTPPEVRAAANRLGGF